jgi:hypothetical protein
MGYLVCDKCGGYYELQPGELPQDFIDKCNCGGNLGYAVSIDVINENYQSKNNQSTQNSQNVKDKENLPKEDTKMTSGVFIGINIVVLLVCFFVGLFMSSILGSSIFLGAIGAFLFVFIGTSLIYLRDGKE